MWPAFLFDSENSRMLLREFEGMLISQMSVVYKHAMESFFLAGNNKKFSIIFERLNEHGFLISGFTLPKKPFLTKPGYCQILKRQIRPVRQLSNNWLQWRC